MQRRSTSSGCLASLVNNRVVFIELLLVQLNAIARCYSRLCVYCFCFAKIAWQSCAGYPRRIAVSSKRFCKCTSRSVAGIIAAFTVSSAVVSAEQQGQHFEVPAKDVAKAEELGNQIAGLSRKVDPNKAKLLARSACVKARPKSKTIFWPWRSVLFLVAAFRNAALAVQR